MRSIQHKWVRVIDARYGMRGVRAGEASHPGPPGSLLRRLRTSRQGALTPIDTADRTDVDSEALLEELARDLSVHDGSASPLPTAAAASGQLREVTRHLVLASARPTVVEKSTDSENEVSQLRGNRFAVLGESQEGREIGNRRRLVLISQRAEDVRDREREWDSDTKSVGCASDVEVNEVVEPTVAEIPVVMEARVRAPVRAFANLDAVNLVDLFDHWARVMRSVPHVLKGAFRMALRVAFQEIFDGTEANSEARVVRGWKLFLLLPRMLLFRPPRGGVVPRKKLESRIKQFKVSGTHSCATALPAVRWPTHPQ